MSHVTRHAPGSFVLRLLRRPPRTSQSMLLSTHRRLGVLLSYGYGGVTRSFYGHRFPRLPRLSLHAHRSSAKGVSRLHGSAGTIRSLFAPLLFSRSQHGVRRSSSHASGVRHSSHGHGTTGRSFYGHRSQHRRSVRRWLSGHAGHNGNVSHVTRRSFCAQHRSVQQHRLSVSGSSSRHRRGTGLVSSHGDGITRSRSLQDSHGLLISRPSHGSQARSTRPARAVLAQRRRPSLTSIPRHTTWMLLTQLSLTSTRRNRGNR